jgi:quercetin dioxygenase-like cupin family protein
MLVSGQQLPVPSEQEPLHKTVFKNEYVTVLHVVIPPGESTLFHTHSHDAIIVCLSDARVREQEPGKEPEKVRNAFPGMVSANDYTARPYTHKVINAGETDFSVLDVEAQRRPNGPWREAISDVAAESPNMRAYHWELAPGAFTPQHSHERPYLIIAATGMNVKITAPDGSSSVYLFRAGDLHWVDANVTHTLTNQGEEKGVIVEVEMK